MFTKKLVFGRCLIFYYILVIIPYISRRRETLNTHKVVTKKRPRERFETNRKEEDHDTQNGPKERPTSLDRVQG